MRLLATLLLLPTLAHAAGITLKQVDSVSTTAVVGSSTSVDINWTDAPNGAAIIGYIIEQCPNASYAGSCSAYGAIFTVLGRTAPNTKTFRAIGLTAGTTYTFRVYEDPGLSATGTPTTLTTTSTTTTLTTSTTSTSTTTTTTTSTTTSTTTTTTSTTTTGTGPTTTSTTTTTITTTTTTTSTSTTTTTTTSTTTTTMTGNDPKLIGFVAGVGSAHDVVADPSSARVYVTSSSFGLSVVDATTPSAMIGIGGANPSFVGQNVAVSGTVAVTANNLAGFSTVDLTTPTAPLTKATLTGTFRAVALAGTTAYAIQNISGNPGHTDFVVINVSTLTAPSIIGRVTVPGGTGIKVVGTNAFVATGGGLQVVNVSTPSAPTLSGFVATAASLQSNIGTALSVSGNTAYAAEDPNGVRIFNITNPAAPGLLTTIATPSVATAVSGTSLFVVSGATLKIYDVSNPTAPMLLGSGTSPDGASFVGVNVKGTTAFTANSNINPATGAGGVYAWNVSNPASPTILGHFSGLYDNWGVARSGTLAVQTQNALGLKVVNVASLAAPAIVGSLTGTMREVVMAGTHAYVDNNISGNPGHQDLIVVDLATPSAPSIVGRLTIPGGITNFALNGTNLYIAGGASGTTITVVDVSNPALPSIVNTVSVGGGGPGGLALNGNRLYFASSTEVRVFDVSTPTAPAQLGSTPMSGQAYALAVSGTAIAVVDGLNLKLIDASVPSAMVLKSTTSAQGGFSVAFDSTNRVFLTTQNQKIAVVNATNLVSPVLQKTIPVAGAASSAIQGGNAVAQGNNVFIGDSAAVIDILQITF